MGVQYQLSEEYCWMLKDKYRSIFMLGIIQDKISSGEYWGTDMKAMIHLVNNKTNN